MRQSMESGPQKYRVFLFMAPFLLFYLLIIFPRAFFRHDDWLILGNSIWAIETDWRVLFRPTLMYQGFSTEGEWFFRPCFKLFPYFFFRLFQFNYYLWLTTLFILQCVTLITTFKILKLLKRNEQGSLLFLILYTACFHLHFASTTWIGEGMMNVPQMFFLGLTTLCFCKAILSIERKKNILQLIGVLNFILALGLKESSVLHLGFLFLIAVKEHRLVEIPLKRRCGALFPYFAIGLVYLYFRLFQMGLNKGYHPQFSWQSWKVALGVFSFSYLVPLCLLFLLLWLLQQRDCRVWLKSLPEQISYVGFIVLTLLPYFGHDFFSPGWLYSSGHYFLLCLCLTLPASLMIARHVQAKIFLLLSLFCLLSLGSQLHRLGWWHWHLAQRQLFQLVGSLDPKMSNELIVFNCPNTEFPTISFERTLGFEASIFHLWFARHRKELKVSIRRCREMDDLSGIQPHQVVLRWEFPKFTRIHPS